MAAPAGVAVRVGLRALRGADLPAVLRIQREAYGDAYQESATVLGGKLALARASCWGAEAGGVLLGYAFAHPWRRASPPPLHAALESLPAAADAVFVHDVAIAACARGHGLAARLLARIEAAARAGGYPALSLVALGDALTYWQRHGFVPVAGAAPLPPGYGAGARFLQRAVVSV